MIYTLSAGYDVYVPEGTTNVFEATVTKWAFWAPVRRLADLTPDALQNFMGKVADAVFDVLPGWDFLDMGVVDNTFWVALRKTGSPGFLALAFAIFLILVGMGAIYWTYSWHDVAERRTVIEEKKVDNDALALQALKTPGITPQAAEAIRAYFNLRYTYSEKPESFWDPGTWGIMDALKYGIIGVGGLIMLKDVVAPMLRPRAPERPGWKEEIVRKVVIPRLKEATA